MHDDNEQAMQVSYPLKIRNSAALTSIMDMIIFVFDDGTESGSEIINSQSGSSVVCQSTNEVTSSLRSDFHPVGARSPRRDEVTS